MKQIYAKDYGILPGREVAASLNGLLKRLTDDESEKTLILEPGIYDLDAEQVPQPFLYITNTIGDDEWKTGEVRHRNRVGMLFDNLVNLTVEGNGAVFCAKGAMTNIAALNCRNLHIKNIVLDSENPDMHALRVIAKGVGYVDFQIDSESRYLSEKGKFYFVGKGYKTAFCDKRFTAHWIGKIPAENDRVIFRTAHPLRGAVALKETAPHRFRARYIFAPRCRVGDEYYLFDVRRKYQGIFASGCSNLQLEGIRQQFNYGLASVFQDCRDISVKHCAFSPRENATKKMASVADFMQICCCRGTAVITDNVFCGAGDDCLNVHGIHFAVKQTAGNQLIAAFMHPQSHGFCPFRAGDTVRFVNPDTLIPVGENVVKDAVLQGENRLLLTLSDPVPVAMKGMVVENASACPDVVFAGNSVDRVITRGLLITTSGKVLVEDNDFYNTSMHAILIADDARNWFESGFVRDVTIKNNRFYGTNGYYVCVKPENRIRAGYVHAGIAVESNLFDSPCGKGLYFRSAGASTLKNNRTLRGKALRLVCSDLDCRTGEER